MHAENNVRISHYPRQLRSARCDMIFVCKNILYCGNSSGVGSNLDSGVVISEIVSEVDRKLRSHRRLMINDVAEDCPHLERTTVCNIVTETTNCARLVPNIRIDQHKEQKMSSRQVFLNRY